MTAALEVERVSHAFGRTRALDEVSLRVEEGSFTALLGVNGAGKTTLFSLITRLYDNVSGRIAVFGHDLRQTPGPALAELGVVFQSRALDADLSVAQNLAYHAALHGLPARLGRARAAEVLAQVGLAERARSRVRELSGGQQRRAEIARCLMHRPRLLLLDEPTTGLDPQARVMIWRQLLALKRQGKTLLLTTHYMDEAERLCDMILMIDNGAVLDSGTPRDLIGRHVKAHVLEIDKPLPRELPLAQTEDLGDSVLLFVDEVQSVLEAMPPETVFNHRPANLEDVFLRLTGRQLRER